MAEPSAKKSKNLQAEIDKYRKALAADPGSRLFAALADALRRAGELKAAIDVAQKGVTRHPRYLSGLVVLGQALYEDAQLDQAAGLFQTVVKMNPENIIAQRALAEIYNRAGDHANALKTYRTLTVLDPNDARARQQLEILEATAPRTKAAEPPAAKPEPAEPTPEPSPPAPEPAAKEAAEPPASAAPAGEAAPVSPEPPPAPPVPSEPDEDRTQEITSPGLAPPSALSPESAEDSSTAVIPVVPARQEAPPPAMPPLPDDFFIPPAPEPVPESPAAAPETSAPAEPAAPPADSSEPAHPPLPDLPLPEASAAPSAVAEPVAPAPVPVTPASEPGPSSAPEPVPERVESSAAPEAAAPVPPPSEPPPSAEPEPSPAAAAPELKSEPAPAPVQPTAATAPASPAKPLSEEEKLDLFFSGVSIPNGGPVRSADRYVVKKAGDVFTDQSPAGKAAKESPGVPRGPEEVEVTQSVLGRVYWRQGFHRKALAVMAEEIREHPEKKGLKIEFIQACLVLDLNPAEVLITAGADGGPPGPPRSERERALADRFFEGGDPQAAESKPAPAASPEPEPPPDEPDEPEPGEDDEPVEGQAAAPEPPPPSASAPEPAAAPEPEAPVDEPPKHRIDILRSYLKKIKRDKGEAQ